MFLTDNWHMLQEATFEHSFMLPFICYLSEHETDTHYFYIKHNYGEKWSCFVESYVYTLLNSIAGADVMTERVGENILVKIYTN